MKGDKSVDSNNSSGSSNANTAKAGAAEGMAAPAAASNDSKSNSSGIHDVGVFPHDPGVAESYQEPAAAAAAGRQELATATDGEQQRKRGSLRGSSISAAVAAQEAAAAAVQAVSAAETAAAAAFANNSSSGGPADIRKYLFPSWEESLGLPNETQGTQVFIERDGSIRLDVHPSGGGYRPRRGNRGAQNVLAPPYGDDMFGDGSPSAFSQGRPRLAPLPQFAEASAGSGEAAVAVEELMLLERLKATGADAGLRAHLEEALQQQVHALGSNTAFIETSQTQDTQSSPWVHGIQGYFMAFIIGFGGFLGVSILICCVRALYVKHMKKKLEAQLAALQATPEEQAAALEQEEQRQEGWVDVSVQEQKPGVDEEVRRLASQTMPAPSRQSSKAGEVFASPKTEKEAEKEKKDKEKKEKKERKKGKHKHEEEGEGEKKASKKKHKKQKEKELRKVLSSKRTLKLGA